MDENSQRQRIEVNDTPQRWTSAAYACLACAAVLAWQAATVQANFDGNWTALFCTGERLPIPQQVRGDAYVFSDSTGYDGQFYRYIAHDPLVETDLVNYQNARGCVTAASCFRPVRPRSRWARPIESMPFIPG